MYFAKSQKRPSSSLTIVILPLPMPGWRGSRRGRGDSRSRRAMGASALHQGGDFVQKQGLQRRVKLTQPLRLAVCIRHNVTYGYSATAGTAMGWDSVLHVTSKNAPNSGKLG